MHHEKQAHTLQNKYNMSHLCNLKSTNKIFTKGKRVKFEYLI